MAQLDWGNIGKSIVSIKGVAVIIGLVALLGAVMFTVDRCDTYRQDKAIQKNVEEIANKKAEIVNAVNDKNVDLANRQEKVGELHVLTNSYLDLTNKDQQARIEANQAIANVGAVVNANLSGPATQDSITKKLDQLQIK